MTQRYCSPGLAVFVAACLAAITLLCLQGCNAGQSYNSRPHVYKRSSTMPAKPHTYLRCKAKGDCEVWDSRGQRRYDLERP